MYRAKPRSEEGQRKNPLIIIVTDSDVIYFQGITRKQRGTEKELTEWSHPLIEVRVKIYSLHIKITLCVGWCIKV